MNPSRRFLESARCQWFGNLTCRMGRSGEPARRLSEHRLHRDAARAQQQLNRRIQSTLAGEATDIR